MSVTQFVTRSDLNLARHWEERPWLTESDRQWPGCWPLLLSSRPNCSFFSEILFPETMAHFLPVPLHYILPFRRDSSPLSTLFVLWTQVMGTHLLACSFDEEEWLIPHSDRDPTDLFTMRIQKHYNVKINIPRFLFYSKKAVHGLASGK